MTSPAHVLRRAALALGVTSVAVLGAATAATAAAGRPAAALPACTTSQLTGWLGVPFRFQTCTGRYRNLAIRVVRHGAGIPGYSQ